MEEYVKRLTAEVKQEFLLNQDQLSVMKAQGKPTQTIIIDYVYKDFSGELSVK